MTLFSRYGQVTYLWVALKDAGWMGAIGLICMATLLASSIAMMHARARREPSLVRRTLAGAKTSATLVRERANS